ncbi:lysophospholipase, partial [Streptomyces sp. RSD-27]
MRNGEPLRYVALGDSQTEGVGDGDDTAGLRGFADRLAGHLAATHPGLLYANLAVRGRLAGQIRAGQLGPALELRPDVATVVAGVNDLLRPRFDAAEVAGELEEMFAALTAAGARVATVTFPDVARIAPMARPLRPRVEELNARVRAAAARHGVLVAETA